MPGPQGYAVEVTAPPDVGGLVMLFANFSIVGSHNTGIVAQRFAGPGVVTGTQRQSSGAGTTGASLSGFAPLAPGESGTYYVEYAYSGSPSSLATAIQFRLMAVFLPNGVLAGSANPPSPRRYWDGNSWRPNGLVPADGSSWVQGSPPSKVNTTTDLYRSPSTGKKDETTFTFTAAVNRTSGIGVATGSVTFQVKNDGSSTWVNVATVTLAGGIATYKRRWTSAGTHSVRALYNGSSVLNKSTSSTVTVTVTSTAQWVTKTKTVSASWVQAYNGSGGQISGSGNDGAVHQGYYSGTHGNRKSLIGFNPNLPSDARIKSVKLKCSNWQHWFYNAGGTLRVGWHTRGSKPATYGVGAGDAARSSHSVDTGSWTVTITGWADSVVKRGDFGGIVIGPGASNSTEYFGYSAAGTGPWDLIITYETQE
jgi:hypothetical protein